MNLLTGDKTFVSRLRVRRSGLDPLTTRLRLVSLFQAADVHPAGLSPAAIVCVRRLNDPRPRTVSLARGQTQLPAQWQASVRASIEHLVRRAPHPARERVAADEPCVIFEDRAELFAALALDWCEHRALTRWWWQSLFKEAINYGTLSKLWQGSPEYVPGALEHLARRAQAARFIAALTEDSARAILQSLTRRFALSRLDAAVFLTPQVTPRERRGAQLEESLPHASLSRVTRENLRAASGEFEAPWRGIVPESNAPDLSLSQQCLLGIGLVLQRAPALARSVNFAHRAGVWIDARTLSDQNAYARAPEKKETRNASAPQIDSASKLHPAAARDTLAAKEDARALSHVSQFDTGPDSHASEISNAVVDASKLGGADKSASLSETISTRDVAPAERDDAARFATHDAGMLTKGGGSGDGGAAEVEFNVENVASVSPAQASEAGVERTEIGEHSASMTESDATADVRPALIAHIETRYGGLFHLVNLALFLELYGDFTSPSEPGIALPIWDFVALLGRRLVGAGVERDPIWSLLAQLAGRVEGQQPGEDFAPPDEWRVPVEWLRVFPQQPVLSWTTTHDAISQTRLQIIHPEKFLLLDVPLDREAGTERQLARELEVYAGVFGGTLRRAAHPYKLSGRTRTPLARWVELLHAFVRARLQRALGTVDARRAARLVCERHASVFVTTTHVDIVMRLAELPFEVRVAGLDRDPGWVPAAGRFIAFHFE